MLKLQSHGDNVPKMVRKQSPTNSKLKVNLKRFNLALPRWTVGSDGKKLRKVTFIGRKKMPELEGWFERTDGNFSSKLHLSKQVLEMIDYDQDFGHTDMEITWDDKDVTKQVYSMVTAVRMVREDT